MPRPSSYTRPYGAAAAWNRQCWDPVANQALLPLDPAASTYASNMWNYASDRAGNFNLRAVSYTYPVYYVSDATGTFPVTITGSGNLNGQTMPWNPAWTAASGSDAQIIVLDPSTGYEYNLFTVSAWNGTNVQAVNGNLVQSGQSSGSGSPGDYRSKVNAFAPSRGCGIQYFAMLVTPEEISQSYIPHALSMPTANTVAGSYVAPATKSDLTGVNSAHPLPQGMRFCHTRTDAQIETWVATKSSAYRNLARTVAKALRDFGWFVTDHSGSGGWQFEATNSAHSLWAAQGIDETSATFQDLFGEASGGNLFSLADIQVFLPSDQYPALGSSPADRFNQRGCLTGVSRGISRGVIGD